MWSAAALVGSHELLMMIIRRAQVSVDVTGRENHYVIGHYVLRGAVGAVWAECGAGASFEGARLAHMR